MEHPDPGTTLRELEPFDVFVEVAFAYGRRAYLHGFVQFHCDAAFMETATLLPGRDFEFWASNVKRMKPEEPRLCAFQATTPELARATYIPGNGLHDADSSNDSPLYPGSLAALQEQKWSLKLVEAEFCMSAILSPGGTKNLVLESGRLSTDVLRIMQEVRVPTHPLHFKTLGSPLRPRTAARSPKSCQAYRWFGGALFCAPTPAGCDAVVALASTHIPQLHALQNETAMRVRIDAVSAPASGEATGQTPTQPPVQTTPDEVSLPVGRRRARNV